MFFYSLDISSIVTIVLFILLAVLVAKGVRTVSQGEEWVVERLWPLSADSGAGLVGHHPAF